MYLDFVYVLIVCVSGILYFNNVFGDTETENSVGMLNDIRIELNNLKLSNERNERRIMYLERQVHECNTKNSDRITAFANIEKRLADKVEARNKEISNRFEALEISCSTVHNKRKTNVDKKRTVVDSVEDELVALSEIIQGERKAGIHRVDASKTVDSTEDELRTRVSGVKDAPVAGVYGLDSGAHDLNDDVYGKGNGSEPEPTTTIERTTHVDKRIVPVTSRPAVNTRIAFSAYMSDALTDLKIGQTLPFDHVHTNEGHSFNSESYKFTCPVSGIYYFTSSVVAQAHEKVLTKIVRDGFKLADMYSDSSSNSVVTVCNEGDTIWVESDNDGSVFGNMLTTFSGFFVSE